MTQIKIAERETEEYALRQPDLIRVAINPKRIISDNRREFFGNYYLYLDAEQAKGGRL